jgi:hypothetical protein
MNPHGLIGLEARKVITKVGIGHAASARKNNLHATVSITHGVSPIAA